MFDHHIGHWVLQLTGHQRWVMLFPKENSYWTDSNQCSFSRLKRETYLSASTTTLPVQTCNCSTIVVVNNMWTSGDSSSKRKFSFKCYTRLLSLTIETSRVGNRYDCNTPCSNTLLIVNRRKKQHTNIHWLTFQTKLLILMSAAYLLFSHSQENGTKELQRQHDAFKYAIHRVLLYLTTLACRVIIISHENFYSHACNQSSLWRLKKEMSWIGSTAMSRVQLCYRQSTVHINSTRR